MTATQESKAPVSNLMDTKSSLERTSHVSQSRSRPSRGSSETEDKASCCSENSVSDSSHNATIWFSF